MRKFKDRIIAEGLIYPGNILGVGSFLNQKVDTLLAMEMAKEIQRLFSDEKITLVLTIESSGITLAFAVAYVLQVPLVFAKKHKSGNLSNNLLTADIYSYTHNTYYNAVVDAEYISPEDSVLIVDDFLANGEAIRGMIDLVSQAKASFVGCAIAIEKGFLGSGDILRGEGIRIESLAIVESMLEDEIVFRE